MTAAREALSQLREGRARGICAPRVAVGVEDGMDDQRFDDLTRRLGVSVSRKRFVALLTGAFSAGAIAAGADIADAKKRGKSKKRKRRSSGPGLQGINGSSFCSTLCDSSGVPSFCDAQSSCTSDANCPATQPFCCQTGSCSSQSGAGVCCGAPVCAADLCEKDSDCANSPGCLCNTTTDLCEATTCAGGCFKDSDCPDFAGCVCNLSLNSELQAQGSGVPPGQCGTRETCGGPCVKDSDCAFTTGCVCDEATEQCVTATCPGSCTTNDNCTVRGQDGCACFLGVNTADAAAVDAVVAQGEGGACGLCRGSGETCTASSECCGQLVCEPSGASATGILTGTGTCQHKPKPHKRCKKHGQGCQADRDCCAQGTCYKGQCGEKDTHCNNDGECARGYRCQGGPLAPGHRRCRKNGRKRRNKTHRRNG
jgi:hypothetical protein